MIDALTLTILCIIFSVPACVLGMVFSLKIFKKIKYLLLSLSIVSILFWTATFILIFENLEVAIGLGLGTVAISIPTMCVSIHIYKKESEFLLNRSTSKPTKQEPSVLNADYISELRSLKELLDEGIITQEEFNKKKDQIFNSK